MHGDVVRSPLSPAIKPEASISKSHQHDLHPIHPLNHPTMSHQQNSSQHPNHPTPQHPPANQAGRGLGGQQGGSPSNPSPLSGDFDFTERSNENPDGSHTFTMQWQRRSGAQPDAHMRRTWEAWMAARDRRQAQSQQPNVPVGAVQGQAQPGANAPPGPSQATLGPAVNHDQNHASAPSNPHPSQTSQAPDQPTGGNQNNRNPPA